MNWEMIGEIVGKYWTEQACVLALAVYYLVVSKTDKAYRGGSQGTESIPSRNGSSVAGSVLRRLQEAYPRREFSHC